MGIVLDGTALASARWPVTIDPLIGVSTMQATLAQTGIDVAYHWRRGEGSPRPPLAHERP